MRAPLLIPPEIRRRYWYTLINGAIGLFLLSVAFGFLFGCTTDDEPVLKPDGPLATWS
jgi:hypothetical protein